jgi:hypothetical protein
MQSSPLFDLWAGTVWLGPSIYQHGAEHKMHGWLACVLKLNVAFLCAGQMSSQRGPPSLAESGA